MLDRENQEDLKKEIKLHLIKDINLIDVSFDLGEVVDKYFAVLNYNVIDTRKEDLKGLYRSKVNPLSSLFLSDYKGEIESGSFCKNFEPYLKKLYYMLEENTFFKDEYKNEKERNTLLPILNKLNKLKELYSNTKGDKIDKIDIPEDSKKEWKPIINKESNKPQYRRLYASSLSFDKYEMESLSNLQVEFDGFIPHLINAINLKNEQSHQSPKINQLKEVENLKSTLIAELFITHFCRKEIGLAIRVSTFNDSKYKDYVSNEFVKYQNKTSNYVGLNLVELSNSATPDNGLIEEILLNSNRIRILGQGGTGKTTTLEYLVFSDLKKIKQGNTNAKIPVLITIGTLSRDESIIEHISKRLNIDGNRVNDLLNDNKLNLYIDGINEIVSKADDKRKRIRQIVSLLEDHEKTQLIISDRYEFDEYQSNMFNLPTFLLDKLTEEQVKEFVKKYCNKDEESMIRVFTNLKDNENIHSLFLRPLMLTRAIEIIRTNNELPKKEGLVIEKFIDSLLIREKNEKLDPLLRISDFKRLLSYVANHIWNKFNSNQAINEIDFTQKLKDASIKFGVEYVNPGYTMRIAFELEIISRDNEMIQFFHQSYLEFFCSYYLKYDINV